MYDINVAGLPTGVVKTGFVHSEKGMIRAANGVVEEKPVDRKGKIVFERSITINGNKFGPKTPISKIKMKSQNT